MSSAQLHYQKALEHWSSGRLEAAKDELLRLTATEPSHFLGHMLLFDVLLGLRELEQARMALYTMHQQQYPRSALAGAQTKLLLAEGRFVEAAAEARRAIANEPENPLLHSLLAQALRRLNDFPAAFQAAGRAVELAPLEPQFHNNLGVLCQEAALLNESLGHYRRAWEINPHYTQAKMREGMVHLLLGDWEKGWPLYEARLEALEGTSLAGSSRPVWDGAEPLKNRVLLLRSEQGLGDTIHFLRYAPVLAAQGARVIAEIPGPLLRLLEQYPIQGIHGLVVKGTALPEHDFQCPILSLGDRLRLRPTPEDCLPAPYLQRRAPPQPQKNSGTKFNVGVCWAGNPSHFNDANRSIPLALLSRLFDCEEVDFVVLQKMQSEQERELLTFYPHVQNPAPDFADMADTAACLEKLDWVITVDTSVAHLAGALGVPTWLLLPHIPDWRWGLNGETCLWYERTRLFRQTTRNSWPAVVEKIFSTLKQTASNQSGKIPQTPSEHHQPTIR